MSGLDKVSYALRFAAMAHKNQKRKDKEQTPYINHLIEVFDVLVQHNVNNVSVLAAGILHDTVEDTNTTFEQIKSVFGHHVEEYLRELTYDKSLPKVERKELQITRSKSLSNDAKIIKAADIACNLRDTIACPPVGWTAAHIRGYWVWSYAILMNIMGVSKSLDDMIVKFIKECFPSLLKLTYVELQNELQAYYKLL